MPACSPSDDESSTPQTFYERIVRSSGASWRLWGERRDLIVDRAGELAAGIVFGLTSVTIKPASQPAKAGGATKGRARAASRYPEGSRAGVAGRSDRLPQAVRASRSCDHPHND
jgi:hypothetical protein